MTLLAQVLVGLIVVAAVAHSVRRHRRSFGDLLSFGLICWVVGFIPWMYYAMTGDARLPNAGHLLWLVALPLMIAGLHLRQSAHTQYVGPELLLDSLVITFATLVFLCRWALYRPGQDSLGDIDWVPLLVLFVEVAMFSTVLLLVGQLPRGPTIVVAVGAALFVAGDAMLIKDAAGLGGWRVGVAVVGALAMALAALRYRPASAASAPRTERPRYGNGALVIVGIAIPLLGVLALVHSSSADDCTLLVSTLLILSFAGREVYGTLTARTVVDELAHQAMQDPLTQLANRRGLEDALRYDGGETQRLHVLTLDVDRFKEVNRQLGHTIGDLVLVAVAEVLRDVPDAAAFRLGGDEFALLTTVDDESAVEMADLVRRRCAARLIEVPGVEQLATTVSVGIADCSAQEREREPLAVLNRSAQALRAAKEERNRVKVFSADDERDVAHRALLEQRLRLAVAEKSISFIYQPIVSLRDQRILSLESLARWHDSVLGQPSPSEFIALAEQTGLIHQLGWQCLQEAVELQVHLHQRNVWVGVSVNVSPVQLRRPTFTKDVLALLSAAGLKANAITLEVTEGVFIDLVDPAVRTLDALHRAGVGISIDDFGSGYSSLGYLTRLPATGLKVDRMLTARLGRPESRSVLSALLSVAGAHNVHVVIEGVDSDELASDLIELGARWAQGFLYSRGVAAHAVPELIERFGCADPPNATPIRAPRTHTS